MIQRGLFLLKDKNTMFCTGFFYKNISQSFRQFDDLFNYNNYKITIKMNLAGWKDTYFKSAGVTIMGHGCGVSPFL